MIIRRLVVAVLALASAMAQQRTLVVDRSAIGPYYREISDAVAAAQPGDRIEVHPGNYFQSFTVSIGVDIFAPFGAVQLGGSSVQTSPTIAIVNLPSDQKLRLDGITLWPNSYFGITYYPPILSIQGCAGSVHVHALVTAGAPHPPIASTHIVVASPRVAMTGCTLPALTLTDSNVVFDSCSIQGSPGVAPNNYHGPGDGLNGLALTRSHAFLTGCTVAGGDGAEGWPLFLYGGHGAVGAVGDAASSLQAVGNGSVTGGLDALYMGFGTRQAGISFPPGSVRLGPGVTATSVTPVTLIPEPPHVIAQPLLQGTNVLIQVTNTANQAVLLGIDSWNDLIRLPSVELPFVLTMGATLYAFALPAAANTTPFSLYVPPVPWLANQFVHLQAVTLDGNGALQFSSGGYGRIH